MSKDQIPEGTVTVLFTDLVGSTELNQSVGDDRARDISRALERVVGEAIESNRGVPIKGLGDGVMSAFASARRAIACAQEVQRGVAAWNRQHGESPVEMRIGLHTGEVIEDDGDIHGETVIIAKRIEGAARPGTIYVSDTVHGVLGTARDELIDRGEHDLKGIAAPWRLYEVPWQSDDTAPADRPPYVGRDAERRQVQALVHHAAAGRGALLIVSGEAGVGKSRLVAEAMSEAASVGAVVLTGQCLDMTPAPPFQPVVDQISAAGRALSDEQFRVVIGDNAAEVATLMPAVRQRFDDLPEPPPLPPDQERQYVLHGIVEFIERGSVAQPLVLVYEDVHWADESTLLVLQALAPRLATLPILVIVTHRPVDLEPDLPLAKSLPVLVRQDATVGLGLRSLDHQDVATLLTSLSGSPPPPGLLKMVMSESDGNPYFVEELYRHLIESDKAFDESGAWRTDVELGETEVPKSVQLLVGRRLEGLDSRFRRHLAAAAVIGRTFTFDLFDEVASADEDELFDALEAAERMSLVEDATRGRQATYRFTHELVRQTVLGEFSVARRQRMHLRVARVLTDHDAAGRAVEISNHYDLAGGAADDDEAGAAHMAAAATAFEANAFEDALVHLDRAADREEGDREAMTRTLALRARCLQGLVRIDDALEALRSALGLVDADSDVAFDVRSQLVTLLLDLFRGSEALAEVEPLSEHPRTGNRSDELDVALLVARTHYVLTLDDPEHARPMRDSYERAHAMAVELGDDVRAIRALLPTVWFPDYWHEYAGRARDNVAEATRLAEALGDVDLMLDAEIAQFQIHFREDRAGHASELFARLEERRDPLRLKEHCFVLMWFHYGNGTFAEGVGVCERGIELAGQLGVPPVMYGSLMVMSLTEAGRYDEIEAALAREVTDDEHPFGRAMADMARTYFLARIGAWEPALTLGVEAHRQLEALGRVRMQYFTRRAVMVAAANLGLEDPLAPPEGEDPLGSTLARDVGAELAVARGDVDRAAELATERVERLVDGDDHREMVVALFWAAFARYLSGDRDGAAEVARRGLAQSEAQGQGSMTWRLRTLFGLASGDEEALADARQEFEVTGARIHDLKLRAWFDRQPLAGLL